MVRSRRDEQNSPRPRPTGGEGQPCEHHLGSKCPTSSFINLSFRFRTMQPTPTMNASIISRRSFLKFSTALAGVGPMSASLLKAQAGATGGPLIAYVGTYSSPLQNVRPTQVDLPPGNGRGIHLFEVDRATGAMSPCGVYEQGTSPSCLAFNATGTPWGQLTRL